MIEVSFCIPTYNRAIKCINLVKEILTIDNQNIEVIVSDNYSTDDTVFLLNQIQDERLFIYKMIENKGSLLNTYNTFSKAKGRYIYFTTDKDFLNSSMINSFINFLSKNKNLSCGYCEKSITTNNEIYTKGFNAIYRIGYIGNHPSGYFFNRKILESISYQENLFNKEFVGEFALDFILSELAMKGDIGIFHEDFTIHLFNNSDASKDKSLTIKGIHTNAFYTPESRLKILVNQVVHLNTLELLADEKKKLIMKLFFRGLINSTIVYKNILRNKNICEHYYLKPRNISILEIFSIALNFYVRFLIKTKSFRKQINLNVFNFTYYLFKLLIEKIVKRLKKC